MIFKNSHFFKKKISYLFFIISCVSYSQEIIKIWPYEVPNRVNSNEKEIKFYSNDSTMYSYSKVQVPTLEIHLPPKKFATGEALIIFPGGGYKNLAYEWEWISVSNFYNSKGIATFILKYRHPQSKSVKTSHLAPLQDAQRAVRIVRKNAVKWNINPNKIGVIGFSAGGHLASTLGTQFNRDLIENKDKIDFIDSRPDFMALIYPVISSDSTIYHGGSFKRLLGNNPPKKLLKQYSNDLNVNLNTPPTFIVHSNNDKAVKVENSLRFHKSLNKFGIKNELHIYAIGGHGYSLATGKENLSRWPYLLIDWMATLD